MDFEKFKKRRSFREATVEKVCRTIEEAAQNSARHIVFSEAFISGYPQLDMEHTN